MRIRDGMVAKSLSTRDIHESIIINFQLVTDTVTAGSMSCKAENRMNRVIATPLSTNNTIFQADTTVKSPVGSRTHSSKLGTGTETWVSSPKVELFVEPTHSHQSPTASTVVQAPQLCDKKESARYKCSCTSESMP